MAGSLNVCSPVYLASASARTISVGFGSDSSTVPRIVACAVLPPRAASTSLSNSYRAVLAPCALASAILTALCASASGVEAGCEGEEEVGGGGVDSAGWRMSCASSSGTGTLVGVSDSLALGIGLASCMTGEAIIVDSADSPSSETSTGAGGAVVIFAVAFSSTLSNILRI